MILKKINLFDIFLVAVLIITVIVANYFLSQNKEAPKENDLSRYTEVNLEYEILFETKEEFVCNELIKAEEFYFDDTDDFAGVKKDINCSRHLDTVFNKKYGKLEKVDNPQYSDCYLSLTVKGKKDKKGDYYAGTKLIRETLSVGLKGKNFTSTGIICKIKEV